MGIQNTLRELQDMRRNAGWRIKWIPWQKDNQPEYIKASPISFIGAALFLGAVGLFIYGQMPDSSISISAEMMIALAVSGLALGMFGILYSALKKQAGWKAIDAKCIDREIREIPGSRKNMKPTWAFRLLCVFNFEGNDYEVTPELSHAIGFTSEQKAEKYLNDRIEPDEKCQLWINPKNPLQTIFHKRRWWL